MESHCEELESLANQVEKQAVSETEPEPLIKLKEEMEYKKDNVVSLAQALKETIPVEFKERAQQAVLDSAKIAREGKRRLGDLQYGHDSNFAALTPKWAAIGVPQDQ